MIIDLVLHAIEEKRKQERAKQGTGLLDGDDPFSVVARDLLHSVEHWPLRAGALLDPTKWNLKRLLDASGKFRRPQAYLLLEFTFKNNLVLELYPKEPPYHNFGENDFPFWSSSRYGSQDPENRIVMIHEMLHLRSYKAFYFPKPETLLIELVRSHIHEVLRTIAGTIDVKLGTDLYFEYLDDKSHPFEKKLKSFEILPVEEIEDRNKRIQDAAWLKSSFARSMGISANDFLKLYVSSGKSLQTLSKALDKKGIKAGRQRLKTLLMRLKESFPKLYYRHCKGEREETEPKTVAKIIPFPIKMKGGDS